MSLQSVRNFTLTIWCIGCKMCRVFFCFCFFFFLLCFSGVFFFCIIMNMMIIEVDWLWYRWRGNNWNSTTMIISVIAVTSIVKITAVIIMKILIRTILSWLRRRRQRWWWWWWWCGLSLYCLLHRNIGDKYTPLDHCDYIDDDDDDDDGGGGGGDGSGGGGAI